MELGYYQKNLKPHEYIIPAVVLFLNTISIFILYFVADLSGFGFIIINLIAIILTICLLFPRIFYIMNIDFGNYKNCLLWGFLLILLAFGPNEALSNEVFHSLVKIPLGLFIYLQLMRTLHFFVTKQRPAFGAIWFKKGKKDKFANRRISEDDILFNMLYAGIPILIFVGFTWFNEVYG